MERVRAVLCSRNAHKARELEVLLPGWAEDVNELKQKAVQDAVKKVAPSVVMIETSGGTDPIRCHGHRKGDAARLKDLIERYQTDYYRGGPPNPVGNTSSGR